MSVYVFTGPTLSAAEASRELEAVYLPPAADGDVYRVALKHPQAIGIIDGYFQSVPTVRHKEILWAMSRGIHVFGSASMGALRAAELIAFGMEGVGAIFECYRDGILEDDDEVAIAHGPPETEFVAASEAMVNIRQTLRKAELAGIISTEVGTALERIGKKLFYPDRSYRVLLRSASEAGFSESELARLRIWLPDGQVNQKREDALNMLRVMRDRLAQGLNPKTVSYSFEDTWMWESASEQSSEVRFDSTGAASAVGMDALLDELRLEGDQYNQHKLLGLERFFAIREAHRLGLTDGKSRRDAAESAFRRERDLLDVAQLQQWMNDNGLTRDEFDRLMLDEARARWVHERLAWTTTSCLPEQLRRSGDYPRLLARATAKSQLLESLGLREPALENADLTESGLLQWYFQKRLGRSVSDDPDSYWRSLGFRSHESFRRALLKEYLYQRHKHRERECRQTAVSTSVSPLEGDEPMC